MNFLKKTFALLSSFGFAAVILVFLTLLTWLGTLEQVEKGLFETQKKYFESVFLIHQAGPWDFRLWPWSDDASAWFHHVVGPIPVPLPGVYLLLTLLLTNLVCGGIVRMRKDKARLGILVAHLGIVLMLAAGFVKYRFSVDGNMMLWPMQQKDEFESYYDWDVSIREAVKEGKTTEYLIPHTQIAPDLENGVGHVTFQHDLLPFDFAATKWFKHCVVVPKGPMFEGDGKVVGGYVVLKQELQKEAEQNIPGLYATLTDKATGQQTEALFWGDEREGLTYSSGGKQWLIHLQRKRWKLPFAIKLDKFTFEMHPRTERPAVFLSDVTKIEDRDEQKLKITMNEPLRQEGYTLFQASYGPPNAPASVEHYSVFAVVRNPSDQWPKWSCYIIAVGLLYHFGMKLTRYVKSENRLAKSATGATAGSKVLVGKNDTK
jgi:hypothetical protein